MSRIVKDILVLLALYLAAIIVFGFVADMLALGFMMMKFVFVIVIIAMIIHMYLKFRDKSAKP